MDCFCLMEKKADNDFAENCNRPPEYSLYKEGFADSKCICGHFEPAIPLTSGVAHR
jgi:hypothetical protein